VKGSAEATCGSLLKAPYERRRASTAHRARSLKPCDRDTERLLLGVVGGEGVESARHPAS
jgi:hypothetical protein